MRFSKQTSPKSWFYKAGQIALPEMKHSGSAASSPADAKPHIRWCGRTAGQPRLLPDPSVPRRSLKIEAYRSVLKCWSNLSASKWTQVALIAAYAPRNRILRKQIADFGEEPDILRLFAWLCRLALKLVHLLDDEENHGAYDPGGCH